MSAASAWEIAIKKSMGRLSAPADLLAAVEDAGFTPRPIGFAESARLEGLPLLHGDPFDRMLIAHALEEDATLVTRDEQIERYAVKTMW